MSTRTLVITSLAFSLAAACAADSSSGKDDAGSDIGRFDTAPDAGGGDADSGVDTDDAADVSPDTSTDTPPSPTCGDGRIDPGEECDDGPDNSNSRPDACREDCGNPACGDGVVDTGEECDDGNRADGDACTPGCTRPATDLCTPCSEDDECGEAFDACVRLDDGDFCALECRADRDCPDGFVCGDVRSTLGAPVRQCVPAVGACGGCFDPDRDGFGVGDCDQPGADCDQAEGNTFPGAPELCDGADNDCDGDIDEDLGSGTWYADRDRDGRGDPNVTSNACARPEGYVANSDDCDDQAPFVFDGAAELCDGEDNDCDSEVDEETASVDFFADADGDGFGEAGGAATSSCEPVDGYVTNDDDCDDGNGLVRPTATELCGNRTDDDCDGAVDCADPDCASAAACVGGCVDDGFEDNDTRAAASPLGAGTFDGFVSCLGDDDFFALTLAAGDELAIRATFSHANGDVDISLLDASGRVVASSNSITDNEEIVLDVASSGVYALRVRLYADTGAPGNSYSLDVTIDRAAPTCRDDAFEDNDTQATATRAADGSYDDLVVCAGDADYYVIDLGAEDTLDVTATFDSADGDVDLRLLGPDGTVLDSSLGTGSSEAVSVTATRAGTYAVEVALYGDLGDPGAPYALNFDVTAAPSSCDDDGFENNDSVSAAYPLGAGSYGGLAVCTGDDDFYAVSLGAGDRLDAVVSFSTLDGDVDLHLISPSGAVVASSASLFGSSEAVAYVAPAAGEYTLRVTLNFDLFGDHADYDLDVRVIEATPTCADDASEDNDSRAAARRLAAGSYPSLVSCPGDDDFYAIELGAGDRLTVDATFSDAAGDIDLTLTDSAGVVLASSVSTTDDESLSFTATVGGTYYVRAYLFDDAGTPGNGYALDIGIVAAVPACPTDRLENNDDLGGAEPLPPELYNNLNVCADDEDWYRFPAGAGDTIALTLSFSHAEGDIDLQLVDATGAVLAGAASSTDDETLTYVAPAAATYYARVFVYADTGATLGNSYNLRLRITPAPTACAADALEDDDTTDAATIVGDETITDLNLCAGDDDYFLLFLLEGETLTATADFVHAEGDIDLAVLDAEGATLRVANGVDDGETLTYVAPTSDLYYVRATLYRDTGSTPGNTYDVTFAIAGAPLSCPSDDRLENDDTAASATYVVDPGFIGGLIACPADPDNFELLLFPGDTLFADAFFTHADGDIDIVLLDEAGDELGRSDGTEDDESIVYTATGIELVTLRVTLFGDSTGNTYELFLQIL
ncbi:MAG: pre-peptidase C-terminal domain-containing protein [Myxococcales bacterium]|nr:pre-peptidase C-terminal domain-containing protein [Myxococcales bacterium]